MPLKNFCIFTLLSLLIAIGCVKQEPAQIEESYSETISKSRLAACTRMNLFSDLLEHENLKSVFDCTNWSQQFPQIRSKLELFNTKAWNNLVLPVSTHALNDRNILKKSIAVTQELDAKNGLEDLGKVITALSDTNFYDGMNELMSCASGAECERPNAPAKSDVVNTFGVLDILRLNSNELQIMFTSAVDSFDVLSKDFSKEVTKLLMSQSFVEKRVEMLDLLVSFVTMPRTKVTQKFLPSLLEENNNESSSIFTWVNSNEFNRELIGNILAFDRSHIHAIKDFRSLAELRKMKLKCESSVGAEFFVDLDNHVHTLLKKVSQLSFDELESYLADDLAMHQVALQSCPNFSKLEVMLDGKKHSLDLIRMKKSLVDLIRIPGLHTVAKIVARKLINAADGNATELGDFVALQMKDDYIGSFIRFLRIMNQESPKLFEEYVRYIKSFSRENYTAMSKVLAHLVAKDQNYVWPALNKIWFFFTDVEKNFVFNYLDRHFVDETNYKALFGYYLNIFTILKPNISSLVSDWRDNGMDVKNFDGLKELAHHFHGSEVLAEFRSFFSRAHILKVIELFINGEQLSSWALEVRNALPIVERNQVHFQISNAVEGVSSESCLEAVAASELSILIKDFPKECIPFNNKTLLEKIYLMSQLSEEYRFEFGQSPFNSSGLISPEVTANIITVAKKSWDKLTALGVNHFDFVQYLKIKLAQPSIKNLLQATDSFLTDFKPADNSRFKEKVLLEISTILSNNEILKNLEKSLFEYAEWKKSKGDIQVIGKSYPEYDEKRSCHNELNQKIGGEVCPSKETFVDFVKEFSHLLIRKNNDSPIAARQFLIALDPDAGFLIPYKARDQKAKNLSIFESLDMFWELSDKTRAINRIELQYENDKGEKLTEKVSTMERIEVVIRDVNFDANYLGAHYKNSVTKSFDYSKVVDSKYSLFKVCVGFKFCGKFMNKKERRMANNAVSAFPSLLDVNDNGLHFGDYMKALLGTVVSSSSSASQISSIIRFKKNEDSFNIPWIQTKKQLKKHNGVILSELSNIGAFSNMARWTRDRFGRSEIEFKEFLNSKGLKLINENLLRGFSSSVSDQALVGLFEALNNNSEIASDLWDWISELSYPQLRRVEDTVGNLLIAISSIEKSNPNRAWNSSIELVTWIIRNYRVLKIQWPKRSLYSLFEAIQPLSEFVANRVLKEDQALIYLLSSFYDHFESIVLRSAERPSLLSLVKNSFNSQQAKALGQIVDSVAALLESDNDEDSSLASSSILALSSALNPSNGGMLGLASYIKQSASKRTCRYEGELVVCSENQHYLEPWNLVSFISKDNHRYEKYVLGIFDKPAELVSWITDSLAMLSLETSLGD